MKTVVIIPTYNERDNILPLLKEISKLNLELDILFVDDSSPDGTGELVREVMKKKENIHLITNKGKSGLGNAYMKGMDYAVNKLKADALVQMDADLSHDPKEIAVLTGHLKRHDLIVGSRYLKKGSLPEEWRFHRKFLSYFGNMFIRILLGREIRDWSSGYKAMRKEVYLNIRDEIDEMMFYGYTFQIGFLYKAAARGYSIKEIPIRFRDRKAGKSKIGPEYILNTFLYIIKTKFWF